MKAKLTHLDFHIIDTLNKLFIPFARIALFIVFFWFGFLKVIGLSPAGPLAIALTDRTVGQTYFEPLYVGLALFECLIGILFLVPKAVRIVVPLLFVHMALVSSPLLLVPDLAWNAPFVPTLEGQYIIKNVAVVALAIGIAANTTPLLHAQKR